MIKYKYRIVEVKTGKVLSDWYNYSCSANQEKWRIMRDLSYKDEELYKEKEIVKLDY